MSAGLPALVPAAELLAAVAGRRDTAVALAAQLVTRGAVALPRVDDDLHRALRAALVAGGVINGGGSSSAGRAGELLAVCEVLAAAPLPPPLPPREPRMVFSAPAGTVALPPEERLDALVLDIIRCATTELVIGGAFWNEAGFELLDDVLTPAVHVRHVPTTLIVHPPDAEHRDRLIRWTQELAAAGHVTIHWYRAPARSMMHAKFVIANRSRGYLGTANLTSWGFGSHIEAGVELFPGQCTGLLRFLAALETSGAFTATPPGPESSASGSADRSDVGITPPQTSGRYE